MKLKFCKLYFLAALMFCFYQSQAQFDIEAQLRSRAELRDGYQKLSPEGANPAILVSQRTRLSFSYSSPLLKLKITPQDVRLWGDQSKMNNGVGDNPSLDLFEAYAELKLSKNAMISAGRQQLSYDSRRLLGDRNWNQNGISYDAVVLKVKPGALNLHAGASWNTLIEAPSENPYPASRIKSLNFIWLNRSFGKSLNVSLLHISSGVTRSDTSNLLNFRHTTGVFAEYKGEIARAWGNVYYQYGKNQKGNQLNALLLDADLSFKAGRITPGLGISYLSGNKQLPSQSGEDHLFDVLYGNRHRYFGFMDYFRTFANDTKQGGLVDYYLWLDYKFSEKLSIRNTLHSFALAQTNPSTPESPELGLENDLIARYRFASWGELECGYCFFVPTDNLRELQSVENANFSQFLYVQLILTPSLFSQQPKPGEK